MILGRRAFGRNALLVSRWSLSGYSAGHCGRDIKEHLTTCRHQGGTALNVLFHDGHVERFQAATPEARDALYEDLKWEP